MSKRLRWLIVALAVSGCARGATALDGDEAVAAPQTPADDASWLNGRMDLAAAHGQVVLVEAFHPS